MPLRLYTALGNCLPAGVGGKILTVPYVRPFKQAMEQALGVRFILRNFSTIWGLWTRELLDVVRTKQQVRRALSRSQLVTFNIGENDLLRSMDAQDKGDKDAVRRAALEFRQVYPELVAEILSLVPPGQAIIRTFTIYNPFPNHPQRRYIRHFNGIIYRCCALGGNGHRRKIPVARVDRVFARGNPQELLGWDAMHPSRRGHEAIGLAMAAMGTDPV